MKLEDSIIKNSIRKRTEIYYLVTEKDLKELKSKSMYSELAYILTSILLSAFLTIMITRMSLADITEATDNLLFSLEIIVGILGILFLCIALYFSFLKNSEINNIKGQEDISLTVENFKSSINPNYLTGNEKILVNISNNDKDRFLELFKEKAEFELLKFETHENKIKKEFFTFKIINASPTASQFFKDFLVENSIKFMDYNYNQLIIIKAVYGAEDKFLDVTENLNNLIVNNSLTISATNSNFGDPIYGKVKKLVIEYSFGNTTKKVEVNEKETIKLP